jgi:hypothetical protein
MFLSGLAEEARDLDDYFINYLNIVPDGDNLAIYKFGLTAGAILGPSLLIPLYNRMKFSTLFLIPTLTIFTASVFMLALDNFAIMAILQSIISLCGVFLFSLSMVYMVRVIRSNDKQVAGLNYRALVVPLIGFTLGQLTYGLLRIVVGYFSEMQHSQGILFIDSIFTDSCKITYVATVITSIIVLIALFKYRTIIDITYEPRELGGLFGTLDYQKVFLATLIISAFFGLSGTFTVDTGFVISNFSDIPWTTDNDIRLEIELTIVS